MNYQFEIITSDGESVAVDLDENDWTVTIAIDDGRIAVASLSREQAATLAYALNRCSYAFPTP